jgi:hypothetical protein
MKPSRSCGEIPSFPFISPEFDEEGGDAYSPGMLHFRVLNLVRI